MDKSTNGKKRDMKKYNAILDGYQQIRKLTAKEINSIPLLLRGAAVRFLLTRLHDQLYHPKESYVTPKDPMEYLAILKFHMTNAVLDKEIHGN